MQVIDLTEQYVPLYCECLEDWSAEIKEAGDHKKQWFERMQGKGLRVKLALDDQGSVGGMIQYVPVQYSFLEGTDLYVVLCIWVHGHPQGRGNFQGRGMGKALLQAAEADALALGAKGMAAWGLALPFWMKASWFKKHQYRRVDRMGLQVLLWKPFVQDAVPPKFIRQKERPLAAPGKVTVTAYSNGWCPAQNLALERAKRAAFDPAFKGKVVFREIDTFDREVLLRCGICDALFIDGKRIRTGPPPSYEKIHRAIGKKVKRLRPAHVDNQA